MMGIIISCRFFVDGENCRARSEILIKFDGPEKQGAKAAEGTYINALTLGVNETGQKLTFV